MPALASTAAMIDAIISEHHQVPIEKIGPTYARHRARILRNIQTASDECWAMRDLPMRYFRELGLAITAGDKDTEIDAALNFANEGRNGSVYIPSLDRRLAWRPLWDINIQHQAQPTESAAPVYFSTWAELGQRFLRFFPTPDQAYLVDLFFELGPPELTDDDPGGIDAWPGRWSERLVMVGAIYYEMQAKGDISAMVPQRAKYDAARFEFVREEMPGASEQETMPRYPGSANVWEIY
jgi:hypothetical protein